MTEKKHNNISEHILNRISIDTLNIIICDSDLKITQISKKAQGVLNLKINDTMHEVLNIETCENILIAKEKKANTKFTDFIDNSTFEFDVSYFDEQIIFILTKDTQDDMKMASVALKAAHKIKQFTMANNTFVENVKLGECTLEDYAVEEFNRFKLVEFNSKLSQLYKIENNNLLMECGNLTETIENLVKKIKLNVSNINISLVTTKQVVCDFNEYQLSTALLYLIGNVFEHCGYETPIEINVCDKNDYVRVFVRDYGRGIDPSEKEKIFDVKEIYSMREISNVHLGLPVVKKIITQHSGTVFLTSTNAGTEIWLNFPKTISQNSMLNANIKYTHEQEIDQIIKSMQFKKA